MKLGDRVENLIKEIVPRVHEKRKNCKSCRKRKVALNNLGGIFSN